ncbi:MAG TPA: Gldg family protein [Candidatus Baltobacteraceae bacterium]|nr:Gldg family protein [Candidatus Baltobacteraceae bacterium]
MTPAPQKPLGRASWAELAATIGAACLVAGYLRYTIQGEWMRMSEILAIGGGVLLLAGIVFGFQEIIAFFSKRSSRLGTNATILGLAVLAILAIANFVGYRHHKRFDLTSEKLFTLSDQTQKIVKGLTQDVNIVRFAKTPDEQFDDLMSEYKGLSPHVKYQTVDPEEKPDIARDYGATHMGDIIVAVGPRKETLQGTGEEAVTTAILKVTSQQSKTVCFVTGHGERSLIDDSAQGYTQADQGLKKEDYDTKTINLASGTEVPSDCDVLVIAGPTQPFFPQETAMLSKYLDNGGKALIEVDPITTDKQSDPNLDSIFQAWNINVGKNIVIDTSGMGRLLGAGPAIPLVLTYGDSPITKTLQRTMTFFPLARTVSIADKSKPEPQDVELLMTSSQSFTTPKIEHEVSYNPKTDQMGPLSLGVAASREEGNKNARLVVIGDSDYASNQAIGQASNGDLFFNAIDWLAQDENLISIRPKSPTNRRIMLTQGQTVGLEWFELLLLPGFVIILGITIWWKHR